MTYYVDGKPIDISTHKPCFNSGSEGKIFLLDNKIYKIYYSSTIKNMNNVTLTCHQEMTKIKTKQVVLPNNLIYDARNICCGYVNDPIPGDSDEKTGIINMPSKKFVSNLKVLEEDSTILGENLILMRDLNYDNYLYDTETNKMYIIDPSRYTRKANLGKEDYIRKNIKNLNLFIEELMYLDLKKYKPIKTFFPSKKAKNIIAYIQSKRKDQAYSDFFEKELKEHKSVYEYIKSLETFNKKLYFNTSRRNIYGKQF